MLSGLFHRFRRWRVLPDLPATTPESWGVVCGLFLAVDVCKGLTIAQCKVLIYFGAARLTYRFRCRKFAVLVGDLQGSISGELCCPTTETIELAQRCR